MSCKSLIYAANNTAQTVVAGNIVSFGTAVRRFGNNINISGGNIVVNGVGYYEINASATVTASTAGTVTVTLYKDGVAVPGASASAYAGTSSETININAVIREVCCCESTITAIVSVDGTVNASSVIVKKL